mmetsp:Transcript_420/g.1337  ORF Transcript_420/g.1337 Transcript_420/m.1337 type:complete len:620 (-) Transcript_420:50-1909(-)
MAEHREVGGSFCSAWRPGENSRSDIHGRAAGQALVVVVADVTAAQVRLAQHEAGWQGWLGSDKIRRRAGCQSPTVSAELNAELLASGDLSRSLELRDVLLGAELKLAPLGGDLAARREEAHGPLASDVVLTKLGQSVVHPAKAERLARHRNADVDTDHAGAEAVSKPLRSTTRRGVDARGVAVGIGVLHLDRLLLGVDHEDAEHRAEDLVVESAVRLVRVQDDRRPNPAAARLVLGPVAPVQQDFGAASLRFVNVREDALLRSFVDDRAHLAAVLARLELAGLGHDRFEQRGLLANREQDRSRHAALARATGKGGRDVRRGHCRVAVRERDQVVLGAAEREHLLVEVVAALVHDLGHLARADKGQSRDVRVVAQALDYLHGALDELEHPVWHPGLLHELGHAGHGHRALLRGLEDDAVAHGERDGHGPHRDHDGEVKGYHAANDADRVELVLTGHATAHLQGVALGELREAARPLDGLVAFGHRGQGLGDRLAVLQRGQLGQLVGVLLDEVVKLEHDRGARLDRELAPGRRGRFGLVHGGVHISFGGHAHARAHAAVVRRRHVHVGATRGGSEGPPQKVVAGLGLRHRAAASALAVPVALRRLALSRPSPYRRSRRRCW